jgi:hypothetical protein
MSIKTDIINKKIIIKDESAKIGEVDFITSEDFGIYYIPQGISQVSILLSKQNINIFIFSIFRKNQSDPLIFGSHRINPLSGGITNIIIDLSSAVPTNGYQIHYFYK